MGKCDEKKERLKDLEVYENAMRAFRENPVTYTLEEVEKELFGEKPEGEST